MKKKGLNIYIDVLQNGHCISRIRRSVARGRKVIISPYFSDGISIPFYNFSRNYDLLKVGKKEKIELFIELPFTGVIASKGQTFYLKDSAWLGRTILLEEGASGSLAYRDLRFIIKITRAPIEAPTIRRNPQYYPKPFQFIFRDRIESMTGSLGLLIGTFIFTCILTGFMLRPSDNANKLEGLQRKYLIPFISQDGLATLPEALKFNLDRSDYVPSLIKYYRNITALLNGWPIENKSLLYPSSIELAQREQAEIATHRSDLISDQKEAEAKALQEGRSGTLSIPTSYNASFENKLLETIRKVDNMQAGFKLALESRMRFIVDFNDDPEYEWGNYLSASKKPDKKSTEALSKIVVFGQLNNEKFMYDVGVKLGARANIVQRYNDHGRSYFQKKLLDETTYKTIYIPVGIDFASPSLDDNFSSLEKNMGKLNVPKFSHIEGASNASADNQTPTPSDKVK